MALTRKLLKTMNLEEAVIEQIIEAHTETTDALKKERDEAEEKAAKLPELEKQLADAKEAVEAAAGDEFKAKYEQLKGEFDEYKAEIADKEAAETARRLYKAEVEALGIHGSRADSIVRASDLSKFAIEEGKYADQGAVQEAIKAEWADFIPTKTTQGAKVDNPPANGGKPEPKDLAEALRARYMKEG